MYVVSLHLVSLGGGAQAHLLEVRRNDPSVDL